MSDTSSSRRRATLATPVTPHRNMVKAKRQVTSRTVDDGGNWESDDGDADDIEAASDLSRSIRQRKVQPRQHVARSSTPRKTVVRSTPGRVTPVASPKVTRTPSRPVPVEAPRAGRAVQGPSILSQTAYIAFNTLLGVIRLVHTILAPFYPYIFLTALALLGSSYILYRLNSLIPPTLYYLPGRTLRLLTPRWLISPTTSDIALGRSIAYSPLKLLATPACALTGQLCTVSYFNATLAGQWWKGKREPEVNVAEVARRMAKEAQGARDIFESIATLSEGGMMGRLEYVRVWELGAAIQVGSNLEEKDVVAKGLYELGNLARDLSDELVETNALAIDGFTWLQWEFADLVRILELPPTKKPNTQQLSNRLNSVLKRLSDTLANLHMHASKAHILAQRGSVQGQSLRSELNTIGSDLRRAHERLPGWRPALDAAKHLVVGGDPTKEQLISRDLRLTDETIGSISTLVHDLEETRLGIKGFRDQIGFFDASMMGFHLGAGEHIGVGVEEEVQVLSRVVAEFERAIGRAKGPGRDGRSEKEVLEIDA